MAGITCDNDGLLQNKTNTYSSFHITRIGVATDATVYISETLAATSAESEEASVAPFTVPILLNTLTYEAVIDTGACRSFITHKTALLLGITRLTSTKAVFRVASDQLLKPLGKAPAVVSIGGVAVNHTFFVVKTLCTSVLLGLDFLFKHVASIDLLGRSLVLKRTSNDDKVTRGTAGVTETFFASIQPKRHWFRSSKTALRRTITRIRNILSYSKHTPVSDTTAADTHQGTGSADPTPQTFKLPFRGGGYVHSRLQKNAQRMGRVPERSRTNSGHTLHTQAAAAQARRWRGTVTPGRPHPLLGGGGYVETDPQRTAQRIV